jgi:hypothetical protein
MKRSIPEQIEPGPFSIFFSTFYSSFLDFPQLRQIPHVIQFTAEDNPAKAGELITHLIHGINTLIHSCSLNGAWSSFYACYMA